MMDNGPFIVIVRNGGNMITQFQRLYLVLFGCLIAAGVLSAQNIEWKQTSGPEGGSVTILEESPTGDLFAGTGGLAMYRSTDNGEHWQQVDIGVDNHRIGGPDLIFFSQSGAIFIHLEGSGLQRSTDNGISWTSVLPTLNRRVSMTVESDGSLLAASSLLGLYRSTDDGITWEPVSSKPTREITAIAMGADGDIIAGIGTGPYSFGQSASLNRSTDNGLTWNRLDTFSMMFPVSSILYTTGVILVGTDGSGILRSTDDGVTWALCDTGATMGNVAPLRMPDGGSIVAGIRDRGVARSTDGGATWTLNSNAPDDISAIVARPGGWTMVGTGSRGICHSTNDPSIWPASNRGILQQQVVALTCTSNALFAATSTGQLFRTTTHGAIWDELRTFTRLMTLTTAPDGSIHAAARYGSGDVRILHSTDGGENWTETPMNPPLDYIYKLASHSSGLLFAGAPNGLFVSTDNGISWIRDTTGPQLHVSSISINGDYIATITRGGMIYRRRIGTSGWDSSRIAAPDSIQLLEQSIAVTSDGRMFAGTTHGVWRSINGGSSWERGGAWGEDQTVRSITVTPGGMIVACPDAGGVYASTDGGDTWNDQSSGLDDRYVIALVADSSGYLYGGTQYDGLFRAEVSASLPVNPVRAVAASLYPGHPNPFSGRTTIDFELVHDEEIRLIVVDVMGREVRTLVDGHMTAGRHSVIFDAGGLSAAVYFCRLYTDSGTLINPIIVKR
jgi:photosystem II stability/assembly factor-like uncharacterized protein